MDNTNGKVKFNSLFDWKTIPAEEEYSMAGKEESSQKSSNKRRDNNNCKL